MGYVENSWDAPRWLFNAAIKRNAKQLSVGWFTYMEKEPDLMGRLPPRWNDRGV